MCATALNFFTFIAKEKMYFGWSCVRVGVRVRVRVMVGVMWLVLFCGFPNCSGILKLPLILAFCFVICYPVPAVHVMPIPQFPVELDWFGLGVMGKNYQSLIAVFWVGFCRAVAQAL